ncbi:hypothetical protein NDU88_011314 [Pleurodeles waltl]|uniref:Uncharacterized protein n=1 Tax=Pleurodeles waltl TaxID=8319 RepID=A0AAV7S1F1_PLEWA|nr:hypothetical protein NDU88_011314 [Pleurodeles waltl]
MAQGQSPSRHSQWAILGCPAHWPSALITGGRSLAPEGSGWPVRAAPCQACQSSTRWHPAAFQAGAPRSHVPPLTLHHLRMQQGERPAGPDAARAGLQLRHRWAATNHSGTGRALHQHRGAQQGLPVVTLDPVRGPTQALQASQCTDVM